MSTEKKLDNDDRSVVRLEQLSQAASDLRRHALGLAKAAGILEKDIARERSHATAKQ